MSGTTYRLYAELNEGLVYSIFGDEANPHLLETTTTFFNANLFGSESDFQHEMNIGAWGMIPNLEWDTWVSIGDSYNENVSTVGDLNINNFSSSSWSFGGTVNSDASIFRTPDDVLCLPDANGRVLLGQFTTDGTLSGYINLRGKDANGDSWVEEGISIPQIIPGCIDDTACNYDASATEDNGSCTYAANNAECDGSCSAGFTLVDGLCVGIVVGCTDDTACNYYNLANTDNDTCTYADAGFNCDGTCIDIDGDTVCDNDEVAGCTDSLACNYDVANTDDDGSCIFPTAEPAAETCWDDYQLDTDLCE